MLKLLVGDRTFGDGSIDEIFDHIVRNRLEWFEDPFVQKIVKEIDNTTVINAFTLNSPVLGNISYERLSGGTKALILLYKEPSIDLWGTLLGDNCIPLLCEISEMHDIILKFSHIPHNFPENSKAIFLDNGEKVTTGKEIMDGIFERIVKMRIAMENDDL